jgi:hypothetical protein
MFVRALAAGAAVCSRDHVNGPAPLLADEMIAAFNELADGSRRRRNFATAVKDCASGEPTAGERDVLVSRIDAGTSGPRRR